MKKIIALAKTFRTLGEGRPTVILNASNLGTVSAWAWVQPEIAKTSRLYVHDRPIIQQSHNVHGTGSQSCQFGGSSGACLADERCHS